MPRPRRNMPNNYRPMLAYKRLRLVYCYTCLPDKRMHLLRRKYRCKNRGRLWNMGLFRWRCRHRVDIGQGYSLRMIIPELNKLAQKLRYAPIVCKKSLA